MHFKSKNLKLIFQIWLQISRRRKRQLFLLLILMIITAFSEVLSIFSIVPLIDFIISPEILWQNQFIQSNAIKIGILTKEDLLLPVVALFIFSIIISSIIRLANAWLSLKLAASIGSDLAYKSMKNNLYQKYETQININSANLVSEKSYELHGLIGAINNCLIILVSVILCSGIIISLVIYDIKIAISSLLLFSSSYIIILHYTKKIIARNSKYIFNAQIKEIKIINESHGSKKDILLKGLQKNFLKEYVDNDKPLRIYGAINTFLSKFPKFSIEAVSYIFISLIALYLIYSQESNVNILPKLGLLAFGAQKLLPNLQQIYSSWSRIRSHSESIRNVIKVLNSKPIEDSKITNNCSISFTEKIDLKNIYFKYENSNINSLNKINLSINKGEKLGIIGKTGSGKSSLVDTIIGLLYPTSGYIKIDNKIVSGQSKINLLLAWRKLISYVPQDIFLSDKSLVENIAYGEDKREIDMKLVEIAIKKSQLKSFINNLPMKLNTNIGERGVKLSGGQKQRIGLARGIYSFYKNNNELLVLDEATSALDIHTEEEVIKDIISLKKDITLIMIAHRYSTLAKCDRIIEIKDGRIFTQKSPKELFKK